MQVRLFDYQVDRLKAERCPGAAIIRYAVKRYNRGDFANCKVVQNTEKAENKEKVPQLIPYTIKHRFGIPDAVLRQILDWHWSIPDEKFLNQCRDNVKRLDAEISGMMEAITGVPYTVEESK